MTERTPSQKVFDKISEMIETWKKHDSLNPKWLKEEDRGSSIATYNLIGAILNADPLIPRELKDILEKENGKINIKSGKFAKYYKVEKEPSECIRCHSKELRYSPPSEVNLNPYLKCLGCGYNMSCPERLTEVRLN